MVTGVTGKPRSRDRAHVNGFLRTTEQTSKRGRNLRKSDQSFTIPHRESDLETISREDFTTRCARVAEHAREKGLTLTKMPNAFALVVARDALSFPFPIVTDAREWRETSVEEAFYSVITDAFAWCSARPGETAFATLDAIERSEVPQIKRDFEEQLTRVGELIELLGGAEAMRRIWEVAGIDSNIVAALDLRSASGAF